MHAKHTSIHHSPERQVVKHLAAVAPHIDAAVLAHALVVEAVHLRDLARLVVAAYQRDAVRIAHLERKQQQERLHRVEAAVDEIAQEEVIGLGTHAAVLEELHEVEELAVDVAADGDGRIHMLHITLFDQDLARLEAELLHLRLGERLAFLELLNLQIQIAAHGSVEKTAEADGRLAVQCRQPSRPGAEVEQGLLG